MVAIWSPEAKIVAERRLWLAVLRAQAELGVEVPDDRHRRLRTGARRRRPGLDRRPRAGAAPRRQGPHRGVQRAGRPRAGAQGHDQSRPDRERRAVAGSPFAGVGVRARRGRGGPAGRARSDLPRPGDGRTQPQRRGAGHHVGQAVRVGGAGDPARVDQAAGVDRPLPVARHQRPDGNRPGHARPARRRRGEAGRTRTPHRRFPRLHNRFDQCRAGISAFAGPRRGVGSGAAGRRAVVAGAHHPADGRPRSGHRGLRGRTSRLVGDAAQDEHPQLRAGQRAAGGIARLRLDGRRAGRGAVERRRCLLFGGAPSYVAGQLLRRRRPDRDAC